MSNWVKEENTVVLKFCFLSKFITKAKISNRERKENETKRDIISSKCKKYLTSQKSKWLNWDMFEQADVARKPNEEWTYKSNTR